MAKRRKDADKNQDYDQKGDQRRETPVHSGPTRRGAQGTDAKHAKRSGSDSNENR